MNKKILVVILIISSISLIILIRIQHLIYLDYSNSTGKNKALFGLTEYLSYSYRYYYGIIPAIGFIISLIFSSKKALRKMSLITALVSIIALLFSVFSIWSLFI